MLSSVMFQRLGSRVATRFCHALLLKKHALIFVPFPTPPHRPNRSNKRWQGCSRICLRRRDCENWGRRVDFHPGRSTRQGRSCCSLARDVINQRMLTSTTEKLDLNSGF